MTLDRTKVKQILILTGILIALAIPLMFMLEDFVRDAIVVPLSYQAWLVSVVVGAMPHSYFLAAAIALIVYVALRSLHGKRADSQPSRAATRESEGHVKAWIERLELVNRGAYSKQRFDHHIGHFLLRLTAHEQRLSLRETIRRITAGDLDFPPELDPYLKQATRVGMSLKRDRLAWLIALLLGRPRRQTNLHHVAEQVDPALRYAETHLKIEQREEPYDQFSTS